MKIQLRLLDADEPTRVDLVITRKDLRKMRAKGILARAVVSAIANMGIFALTVGRVQVGLEVVEDPIEVEANVVNEKEEKRWH